MTKRITRAVYLLGLLSLFNDLTADMITPLLPAFLASMGMGATFLGVMEGVANSLSNITMLFSGRYADRHGQAKKITIFGYAVCTFVRPLIAIPIPGVTLMVRWIDRIGKGIRTSPRDRLLTSVVKREHWGEAFGVQRAMDHAGSLIAPAIAAWLLATFSISFSKLFLLACIPSVLSVLIIPRMIHENPVSTDPKIPLPPFRDIPVALKKYVGVILFSALSTPSELFLILKMNQLGLKAFRIPLAWFVFTLFTLLATYLGGVLSDRWSRRKTIGLGWFVFALVYAGFGWNQKLTWAWFLMAFYGVHLGMIEAAERAYPALIVPSEMRATALGWYYFAYGLGGLPASLIFGLLWDHWGSQVAFLFNAGLTLVAIFMLSFLPSDRLEKRT